MFDAGRFMKFGEAYRAGLTAAASAPANGYYYGPDKALEVANKMLTAIDAAPGHVNYAGQGFKNACKALGIKHTRKAILAYLEGH